MNDESYIRLTIALAKKGLGNVSPNPLVGCVIVKNSKIIGVGFHEHYGGPHAEVNAINSATEDVEGATLYVSLEPCSHYGKTPPCADLIIEKKISRVVIGTLDMNPIVSGRGVKKLMEAGIQVRVGVLENECIELNRFFFKYISKKIPYITLKIAQTLDGKIADINRDSKWISGAGSRRYVHLLRSRYDGVLVGSGTVKADNPRLTVRMTEGRNPARIILDGKLGISLNSNLLIHPGLGGAVIIVTSKDARNKPKKIEKLTQSGVQLVFVRKNPDGKLNLKDALKELAKLKITSILVEGGGKVYTSFLKAGLVDEIRVFVCPKIIGAGVSSFGNMDISSIKKSVKMKIISTERYGDDIMIEMRTK